MELGSSGQGSHSPDMTAEIGKVQEMFASRPAPGTEIQGAFPVVVKLAGNPTHAKFGHDA